ncbi:site-specific integrase [Saccharopolyspora sp. NPDC002686]|uniref:tyrosine-type recombinase/integrase n=1 Tax=Saccharopolyspora sp. NPDC002686 TaxID=3154541 RepID=UPI0033204E3B
MAGRLSLPLGSMGEISVKPVGKSFAARVWYRRVDGTYVDVRRRGRTKELAKKAVRDAVKDLVPAGAAGAELTARSYFSEAAELWLAEFRKDAENGTYSLTSLDTYENVYENHVKSALGQLRLFEVKTPVVNKLCQAKLKANSLSLAKLVKAVISNVANFAIQAEAIEENPTKDIAPLAERRAKIKRKKPRSLTKDQLIDFLKKLDADEEANERDLADLVRFFIATAERAGEALGVHWEDFDPKAKKLRMSGNLIRARGKGVRRNDGKTDGSARDIGLADWAVKMLEDRAAQLGEVDPKKPIFTSTTGSYLNYSNVTNRAWKPFRVRAGYEWVTFHTLRKTVATLLADAGVTAREVADLLGHSRVSMTQDVYFGRGQQSRASAEALAFVDDERSSA